MLQKSRELFYAVIAMVFITIGYLVVQGVNQSVPKASSLWGHSIGIIGFVMMLMTETLYSLRKRSRRSLWGKMSNWLEFHIFTGLVGPFMVLLHPGWQFKGLAGVLSLLTVLIVISGIVGRYIFTAIPRNIDGVEINLAELERQAAEIDSALKRLVNYEKTQPNAAAAGTRVSMKEINGQEEFMLPSDLSGENQLLTDPKKLRHAQLAMKRERDRLYSMISRRQSSRRLFSLWHTIHIPLGLTLFMIAFVHIGATIYYAVLLK